MRVAGKCPPKPGELEETHRKGFDSVELHLEKEYLDNFEESLEHCRNSELKVVSVHTPHVTLKEIEYFERADRLAANLDAKLVFHSQFFHHVNIPEIESKLSLKSDYGYENNPGVSRLAIENLILGRDHDLVLDTAHLYMAEEDFLSSLEQLLEEYGHQIPILHLCDSSEMKDGLGFGKGEMDMPRAIEQIKNSGFSGIVVLEVMPEHQEEALKEWNRIR